MASVPKPASPMGHGLAILALLVLGACAPTVDSLRLSATSHPLQITADIQARPSAFGDGAFAVYADVSIANTSGASAPVANSCLKLSAGSEVSRAYEATVASKVIDFSSVELPAGETLRQRVYWVFKSEPAGSLALSYKCEPAGSESEQGEPIIVHGPTIIAFFDVTQDEVDENRDLAEGLSDFQFHTPRAAAMLEPAGVAMHERYSPVFTLSLKGRQEIVRVPAGEHGYCFVTPAGTRHIIYGIGTYQDIVEVAEEQFGLRLVPRNPPGADDEASF